MILSGGTPFGRPGGDEGASMFGTERKLFDLFHKTDMKLPPCPTPKVETWRDRENEITGFHDFIGDLRAWAALASSHFAAEIFDATRAVSEIDMSYLSKEQQVRGSRLLAILKSCFAGHARSDNLIRSFQEGVGTTGVRAGLFCDNGFELLRILTGEYSLKTRSEALALRAELTNKNFKLSSNETSQSTIVAYTVRKLDTHVSRFQKLISTLPSGVDRTGVMITESHVAQKSAWPVFRIRHASLSFGKLQGCQGLSTAMPRGWSHSNLFFYKFQGLFCNRAAEHDMTLMTLNTFHLLQ